MNRRDVMKAVALGAGVSATAGIATGRAAVADRPLAPTPPMGWNSWNSFATTITEAQVMEQATVMRRDLLPSGYDILTVDIQWYEPGATGYAYSAKPVPAMDGHGRLQPAVNRFPSSAGGKGFAPLAARIHAMGLRFGVHLMRGIPRLAVERNLPVLGTDVRARDIADTSSTCPWNPDMFGVDMNKPGAQAYYDGVFALLASWGVDFVKVDDLSRPYDAHIPEIDAIALAIRRAKRPMILSMSPGETPLVHGAHARKHAQMWRISDDFWDEWAMLAAQLHRLENWNLFMGDGGWPDADMLPLGRLALGERNTRFTADEQRMLMTLWSIARSPLIMGGDLRHLDGATKALLTNPEVIAVNQASSANRPLFLRDGLRLWTAKASGGATYVAMFNLDDAPRDLWVDLRDLGLPNGRVVRDLWARADLGRVDTRLISRVARHGACLLRLT